MRHPYDLLPAHTKWSRAVTRIDPPAFDPVIGFPFRIGRDDKVATAGSCFAQHISRHLAKSGFTFLVTEDGHPIGDEVQRADYNYGIYSARFGNLYTTRQLLQLFQQAFGRYDPQIDPWPMPQGCVVDPLRPTIQPDGFASVREYEVDRAQHLRAVKRMFEELDVFVFTLGLTECWFDRRAGAALPLCPGVAGGSYDPATTGFVNLSVAEVVADLTTFLRGLQSVNPAAKVILTVSPVPLAATALDRHVAVSTTYSKAVLRVACEEVTTSFDHVAYFPSYEIITSIPSAGRYYAGDRRSIEEAGVEHVMRLFFAHATSPQDTAADVPVAHAPAGAVEAAFVDRMARVVAVLCDEELLDKAV